MKRIITLLFCFVLLLSGAAHATDESRRYEYELSINGKQEAEAQSGDILTVTAYLRRTDSIEAADMYAIQDKIYYDSTKLELVEGGIILSSGIELTDIAIDDTQRAVYLTFASFSGGEEWDADKLLGNFQMRVIGDTGTATLSQQDYLVSNADGTDVYAVGAKDVSIKLPYAEQETPENTTDSVSEIQQKEGLSRNGMILAAMLAGLALVIVLIVILIVKNKNKKRYHGTH